MTEMCGRCEAPTDHGVCKACTRGANPVRACGPISADAIIVTCECGALRERGKPHAYPGRFRTLAQLRDHARNINEDALGNRELSAEDLIVGAGLS